MPRTSTLDLLKKADSQKLVMVTAYDFTMARLAEQGEVDIILVGDSLGMVVQGHEDTLSVTLDDMIYHARCVDRALQRAHLVVDLPFMTYQVSPEQALESAGRLVKEGRAQSVKLEGGARSLEAVSRIVDAGIPVMGHLGLTPQSVHSLGGFRVQGRQQEQARKLLEEAKAIEAAGAWSLVLEMIPAELAAEVSDALDIPTIGIGAGAACDGQVLVCNDLLGLDSRFKPRFVERFAELEGPMADAFRSYASAVREERFPAAEHSFHRRKASGAIARLY